MIGSHLTIREVHVMRRMLGLVLVIGMAAAGAAEADEPILLAGSGSTRREEKRQPKIDKRQAKQEKRIEKGIENGRLTKGEAAAIEAQQLRIEEIEQQLRKQGLSPVERARLQMELTRASAQIRRLNDNQRTAEPPATK